jgi:hypothetical protein
VIGHSGRVRATRLIFAAALTAMCAALVVSCVFGDSAYSIRVVNECGRAVRVDYRDGGGASMGTRPTSSLSAAISAGDSYLIKTAGAGGVPERADVLIVADGAAEGVIVPAVFEPGSEGDLGTIVLDEECAAVE